MQLFRNTYYVRIRPERLTLTHVESGHEVTDVPLVALDETAGRTRVLAAGSAALAKTGQPGVRVANGFSHPRTLLADFMAAELVLRQFMARLASGSWFAPAPVMILHPLPPQAGGLTPIEIRAFRELGAGAGARKVYLWEGEELTLDQLRTLDFGRADGRLLED